jgi:DNA-binding MarR family transcriptional regulator
MLDEIDNLILLYIFKRYSIREIGKEVKRAPSVVFRRIEILEDSGYIKKPATQSARMRELTELGVRTMQGGQPSLFPTQ